MTSSSFKPPSFFARRSAKYEASDCPSSHSRTRYGTRLPCAARGVAAGEALSDVQVSARESILNLRPLAKALHEWLDEAGSSVAGRLRHLMATVAATL